MVNCTFGDIKHSKTNEVLSLYNINNYIKVHGKKVILNSLTIFQRKYKKKTMNM